MRDLEIKRTNDGSHTLWVPDIQESYHSLHGAITESQHVFISHGLEYARQFSESKTVSILEIGFGTGLNALLTCHYCQEYRQKVEYTTLEPFPLSWKLLSKLNYAEHISHVQCPFWFKELHKSTWDNIEWLSPYFSILKKKEAIQDHTTLNQYDLCYLDAFAPGKQPDMWDMKVLDIVRRALKSSGVLVTYCAQGQFKRNLKEHGFRLESLPGPPGKKEMTRAVLHH